MGQKTAFKIASDQYVQSNTTDPICTLTSTLCLLQFIAALTNNIAGLSGPCVVVIDAIRPGSVMVTTSVTFLSGDSDGVEAYKTALNSSSSSVFGSYAATVDTSSITTANPSAGELSAVCILWEIACALISQLMHHKRCPAAFAVMPLSTCTQQHAFVYIFVHMF